MTIRPIDHLVLPVTTLMLARSRLTSLGFTVAPDARHPFGTGNCCVLFENRTYLEPVTILDRAVADNAAAEGISFVKRLKRFTERYGEGLAMVALRTDDAAADQTEFERAGLSAGPSFRFARTAELPDGSETEIGVVLAFAQEAAAPEATLFACQHIGTERMFQPPFLGHPNGAVGIGGIAAVAENPGQFRRYLAAATGAEPIEAGSDSVAAELDGRTIAILTPAAFRDRFGVDAPDPRRGLLFAGVEVAVADLDRAVGFSGPTAIRRELGIVVPPSPGLGAVLMFRTEHG